MAKSLQQEDVQRVIGAVSGGVAMSVLQWSGSDEQFVAVPWTLISGPAEIDRFAEKNHINAAYVHRRYSTWISFGIRCVAA